MFYSVSPETVYCWDIAFVAQKVKSSTFYIELKIARGVHAEVMTKCQIAQSDFHFF